MMQRQSIAEFQAMHMQGMDPNFLSRGPGVFSMPQRVQSQKSIMQEIDSDFLTPDVVEFNPSDVNNSLEFMMGVDGDPTAEVPQDMADLFIDQSALNCLLDGSSSEDGDYKIEDANMMQMQMQMRSQHGSNKTKRKPAASATQQKHSTPRKIVRSSDGGKTFICTVPGCDKEFRDRSGLRKHNSAKHSFKCPHECCGKVLPTLENFLAHMSHHN